MQQEINFKKIGIGIALAIAIFFFYDTWCPIENIIGIPCPGCNMSTALFYLIRFDFSTAYYFHPFVFIFCVYVILELILYFKYGNLKNKYSKYLTTIMVVLLIIGWILRMIYIFPDYPMGYNENNLLKIILNLI